MKKQASNSKPYTQQFYRGNGGYFALGILSTLLSTASNMLISWLIQQVLDLVSGEAVAFTLGQLALLSLVMAASVALCSFCAFHSIPRFTAKAMEQYKTYVFERLSRKGISALAEEIDTIISNNICIKTMIIPWNVAKSQHSPFLVCNAFVLISVAQGVYSIVHRSRIDVDILLCGREFCMAHDFLNDTWRYISLCKCSSGGMSA